EGPGGSFCLLPQHIDFVSALVPGILVLADEDGTETFFAVDEGLLVKHGADVRVSAWDALQGELGGLEQAVLARFREQGEQEQEAGRAGEGGPPCPGPAGSQPGAAGPGLGWAPACLIARPSARTSGAERVAGSAPGNRARSARATPATAPFGTALARPGSSAG